MLLCITRALLFCCFDSQHGLAKKPASKEQQQIPDASLGFLGQYQKPAQPVLQGQPQLQLLQGGVQPPQAGVYRLGYYQAGAGQNLMNRYYNGGNYQVPREVLAGARWWLELSTACHWLGSHSKIPSWSYRWILWFTVFQLAIVSTKPAFVRRSIWNLKKKNILSEIESTEILNWCRRWCGCWRNWRNVGLLYSYAKILWS